MNSLGSDDLFKKRREERKARKHDYKSVNTNAYLIVTEGKRTEPLYFKGIQTKIKEKMDGRIDIIEIPIIDICGEGCSTGFTCIFVTMTLHFIDMIGVTN